MNIYKLVNKYVTAGYSEDDAIPKVAQDIVLIKIGNFIDKNSNVLLQKRSKYKKLNNRQN